MSWKLRLGGMLKFLMGPRPFKNAMAKLPVFLLLSALVGFGAINFAFAAAVSISKNEAGSSDSVLKLDVHNLGTATNGYCLALQLNTQSYHAESVESVHSPATAPTATNPIPVIKIDGYNGIGTRGGTTVKHRYDQKTYIVRIYNDQPTIKITATQNRQFYLEVKLLTSFIAGLDAADAQPPIDPNCGGEDVDEVSNQSVFHAMDLPETSISFASHYFGDDFMYITATADRPVSIFKSSIDVFFQYGFSDKDQASDIPSANKTVDGNRVWIKPEVSVNIPRRLTSATQRIEYHSMAGGPPDLIRLIPAPVSNNTDPIKHYVFNASDGTVGIAGVGPVVSKSTNIHTTKLENEETGLSIGTGSLQSISKGEEIQFVIQRRGSITGALPITVSVTEQGGSFIDETVHAITSGKHTVQLELADRSSNGSFRIQTKFDLASDVTGTITATIEPDDDYVLDSNAKTHSVPVMTATKPFLSIAADSNTAVVPQDANDLKQISFTVTALSKTAVTSLRIKYDTERWTKSDTFPNDGSYIFGDQSKGEVELNFAAAATSNTYTATLVLQIERYEYTTHFFTNESQVTAKILSSRSAYILPASEIISGRVRLTDASLPTISIAGAGGVFEYDGAKAVFTVTSTEDIDFLRVNCSAESTNFSWALGPAYNLTFKTSDGVHTAKIYVPIVSDEAVEPDGDITVILQPGSGYEISTETGADRGTVRVEDDDTRRPNMPVASISPSPAVATEGISTHVEFTVTLEQETAPERPIVFWYTRSSRRAENLDLDSLNSSIPFYDSQGNLESLIPTDPLTFTGGNGSYTATFIRIPFGDDNVAGELGHVEITLQPDKGSTYDYEVKAAPHNYARVEITDDERPVLTISVLTENMFVTEADPGDDPVHAIFTVTANASPNKVIPVNFEISGYGYDNENNSGTISPTLEVRNLDFSNGKTEVQVQVVIEPNTVVNTGSNQDIVKLKLNDARPIPIEYLVASYVSALPSFASITVIDDEAPYIDLKRTSTGDLEATEGDTVRLTIIATHNVNPGGAGTFKIKLYTYEREYSNFDSHRSRDLYGFDQEYTYADLRFTSSGSGSGTNTYTAHYDLNIPIDNDPNTPGYVIAQVALADSATGKYRAGSRRQKINIIDDDAPYLTIEPVSPVAVEESGSTLAFKIRTRGLEEAATIEDVRIKILDNEGYLTASQRQSDSERSNGYDRLVDLDFTEDDGEFSALLEYDIQDNGVVDRDGGVVTVELLNRVPIANYVVDSWQSGVPTKHISENGRIIMQRGVRYPNPNVVASVKVIDDEVATRLSIAAVREVVTELETASFTITASTSSIYLSLLSNLDVVYSISQMGGFIEEATDVKTGLHFTATSNSDEYVASLPLLTIDNDIRGKSGSFTVSISLNRENPTYLPSTTNSSATVKVLDKDIPEFSITGGDPVVETEGAEAVFTVTSNLTVSGSKTVNYAVGTTTFAAMGNEFSKILQFNNTKTANFSIPIISDTNREPDGSIPVTLREEPTISTYSVSTSNTASTSVIDDDSRPFLSIVATSSTVPASEATGDIADRFTIIAEGVVPQSGLDVTFDIEETGNILSATGKGFVETVTFSASGGNFHGSFSLLDKFTLVNDSTLEVSSTVTVTLTRVDLLVAGYGVKPSPNNQASVKVLDDDSSELSITVLPENMTIVESDPQGSSSTYEQAKFTVTTQISPNKHLDVSYWISETGLNNYLESTGNRTVRLDFTSGMKQSTFEVRVRNNDSPDVTPGVNKITVLLQNEDTLQNYTVDVANNSASVSVLDDDGLPTASISLKSGELAEVDENGTARFTVSLDSATDPGDNGTFRIHYDISESGTQAEGNLYGVAASTSSDLQFTGSLGNYTAPLDIRIPDNNTLNTRGSMTVTLTTDGTSPQYTVTTVAGSDAATVLIFDDDAPYLTIEAGPNVIEANGAKAVFTVHARGMDAPTTLSPVEIRVTDQEGYLKSARFSSLPFVDDGSGSFSASLEYEIQDNQTVDPNKKGEIIVEILNLDPLDGYTVSPDDDVSAALEVVDDESIPVLSISAVPNLVVAEGETASFTVTAAYPVAPITAPSNVFRTVYAVMQTEDGKVTTTQATATLNFSTTDNPKEFTASLQVPIGTISQGIAQSYTVSLAPDDASLVTYRLATTSTSVDFFVRDLDIPVLSIAGDGPVLEALGAMANFTVTSNIDVSGSITVNYSAEASGFNNAANSSYVLEFNGSKTASLSIPIISDTVIEDDADISVTLLPEVQLATYWVSDVEGADMGIVRVLDDDSKPVLSIVAAKSFALESDGDLADSFTLIGEGMIPESPMTVTFNLEETGKFLSSPGTNFTDTVTFVQRGGTFSARFTSQSGLLLDDDSTAEGTSTVTVTLVAGNGAGSTYIVKPSPGNQASVKVLDDEVPELSISLLPENRTVYENSESTPVDVNTPSVNYETVEFTVSTLNSPNKELPVTLMLSEVGGTYLGSNNLRICTQGLSSIVGDFVTAGSSNTTNSVSLDFTGDKTEATFEIRICNNSAENEGSTITVELLRGPNNWVDPENNEVEFTVLDDDTIPYLTIFGPQQPAIESLDGTTPGVVTFEVRSTGPRESVLVNYLVSEGVGSDFLSSNEEGEKQKEMKFEAGNLVRKLVIPLHNDNELEQSGTVTVTLRPDNCLPENKSAGSGRCYNLPQNTGFKATATILDDDSPVLSIAATEDAVVEAEGAMAIFNIISQRNPRQAIVVKYIASSEKYLAPGVSNVQSEERLTFTDQSGDGSGPFISKLEIPIQNNNKPEEHGAISVTLVEDSQSNLTYLIANDGSKTATVSVLNDDTRVSIETVNASIIEGQNAEFTVSFSPLLSETTTLVVNVTQEGSFIFTREKSIIVPPSGSTVYKVATVDDNVEEPDGEIAIEIQPTNSVHIDPETGNSAKVAVQDNDGQGGTGSTLYSVAASVIHSILSNIGGESTDSGAGLSRMSIESVTKSVVEGNQAIFKISADAAVTRTTDVLIALSQSGDFIVGSSSRTVSLAVGRSEVEFAVETQDDDLAESDGTITATIEEGKYYQVGSANSAHVKVSDLMDRLQRQKQTSSAVASVFPNLLANSVSESFEMTSVRLRQAFDGSTVPQIALNGKSSARDLVKLGGEMLNDGELDWESIVDGSSLTIPLMQEVGGYNWATVWGLGDSRSLSGNGEEGETDWKSQLSAGHFGFDVLVGSEFLTGLAVSLTQSDTTYGSGDVEMLFNSQSTGFYPYLGYSSTNGDAQLQVMVGYGLSEIALNQEEYDPEILNGNFQAYGFSGSTRLYSSNFLLEGGSSRLSLTGESWLGQQKVDAIEGVIDVTSMSASHYTVAIRGSHEQVFPMDGKVNPSLSLGLRGDGRNDLSAMGIEVESDIKFEMFNGFTISGTGHTLMSRPGRINKWELGSGMNFDRNHDQLGVQFDVSTKSGGVGSSDRTTIWGQKITNLSDNYTLFADGSRVESELGYGLELENGGAVITPYGKFVTAIPGTEEFRIGGKYAIGDRVSFQFENVRRHLDSEKIEFKHQLNGSIRW